MKIVYTGDDVAGTDGPLMSPASFRALFAPGLETRRIARVFPKGTDPRIDSYSGLFDNGRRQSTGLGEWLREQRLGEIWVVGLATDYCVKATVLDSVQEGFRVTLFEDACRGVNLAPDHSARAVAAMRDAGVRVLQSHDLPPR